MKTWRLFLAIALAVVAVLLMTSIVVAAPVSTGGATTGQADDTPDLILTDTLPTTHPVGIAIAMFFHIPYTQVVALHDEGFGFGVIARAYLTALASHGLLTPDQVLGLRQDGVGWGQIKKEYGVPPGGNGLGSIMGKKPVTPEPAAASPGVESGNNSPGCPGNSCNAPGQQNPPKGKPTKAPKK